MSSSAGTAAGSAAGTHASVSACLEGLDGSQLLAVAGEALRRLRIDPLSRATGDEELAASVTGLQRLETRVHAEKLRRIGELDARKAYRGKAMSTADWLAPHLGLSRGEAKAQTDTAGALARLPRTAERLAAGELGAGHARTAARALGELDQLADAGADVPPDAASRLDDHVAACGPGKTAGQLRGSIDEQHHRDTPEVLAERERRAHARRHAWIERGGPDAQVRFGGQLGRLAGAHLAAAVDALARPHSADDERTPGQRRADAFTTLAEQALDRGELPEVAAQRPHVVVTTTRTDLDSDPDESSGPGGTTTAPSGQPAQLDGFGPIARQTARMVACDGEITEVVVDHQGRPLVVKETGKPTRKQRLAVLARDGCCIGCGAPASRCQLHHVVWRRRNGATVVVNLVLVCFSCHHALHHDDWTVIDDGAGGYTIHRPDTTSTGPGHPSQQRHSP